MASTLETLVTQLKTLIATDMLLPIAGGATVEEYDEAITAISEEKQEIRRKLDSLVTDWLIASKSPDSQARQQAVETISRQLSKLAEENPNDDAPIRVVQHYIVAEYREESTVGQPSTTEPPKEEPAREIHVPRVEKTDPGGSFAPAETRVAKDWELQVQELHRQQYRRRQPQRQPPLAIPEPPKEQVAEPAQWSVEPEDPRLSSMWLRIGVNLAGLLIVGGTILGINHLLGNPIKQGIVWVTTHLPLILDYLKTTVFVQ